ncbi:2Fe-2S iron-sulfur cluster-binding protein [Namhaeicola litoreus]|uniref:2Fe-2S iron-sulfur cluster-binding protein n=1 Tax=Namhaeicola litoreus TaxID=1052145 RepID=A0ABW3XX04_9FLAO
MSVFYPLKVKEVRRETPSSVSVLFEIPSELKSEFRFKPGQYVNIRKKIQEKELRRAYSICSSLNSGEVRIAIKKVEGGSFSVFANEKLKAGDVLEVTAPEGRFILEPEQAEDKYVMFAAGSGITPILSMLSSLLESKSNSQVVLVYGNQSLEETMFLENIETLKKNYPERLALHYVFSRKLSEKHHFGRISENLLTQILKEEKINPSVSGIYICGPEGMIDQVNHYLLKHQFSEDQIHIEWFNVTEEKEVNQNEFKGSAKVKIHLDEEETTFEMRQDETVLGAALAHGVDAPYSCQGGICSSCLAKVTEGAVKMDNNRILSDEELAEGLILTCQAHPITSTVSIDYDDV